MAFKILIVEDHTEISDIVSKYITREGYAFEIAANGFEALEAFSKDVFHLVILDVMMPGIDGFEVLREIRAISQTPVIMLTAKASETDRIKGFDIGADDYVVKPFSPRELMKRIQVVFRRVYHSTEEIIIEIEQLKLNVTSMKLFKNDQEIIITGTEFKLLHTFMEHKGQVLTREQLIELSFGYNYDGIDRNIDSYIKRIRQKIEAQPKHPELLLTKYGVGYVFGGDNR